MYPGNALEKEEMARDKQELQGEGKDEEEGGSRVISITFPPLQSGQRELTRSLQGIRLEFHIKPLDLDSNPEQHWRSVWINPFLVGDHLISDKAGYKQ